MSVTASAARGYRYRAAAPDGRIVRGRLSATDEAEVARRLAADGLSAIEIIGVREWLPQPRVHTHDLAIVFRNVATLVASGVPIEAAIAASEGLVPQHLATRLADARRLVREGSSVADALATMPNAFPRSAVGVLRAGERGSRLGAACEGVADQLEAEAALRSQVRSALAYPVLLLAMGVATVAVMGTVVMPRFAGILSELGAELPASTRALLALSEMVDRFGVVALVAAFVGLPVLRAWLARPSVRERFDRVLLRTPVVGDLRLAFASARICRALGGMLTNGMPLLAALDAAGAATGDLEVTRRLERVRARVARGAPLTGSLIEERALTPLALQLVGVGESSGRLGQLVSRAGEMTAERAERSLRTTVGLLEPLLVILLGIAVAVAAAALLQAVYSVRPI
jgi:type II secretory pathway component PulF